MSRHAVSCTCFALVNCILLLYSIYPSCSDHCTALSAINHRTVRPSTAGSTTVAVAYILARLTITLLAQCRTCCLPLSRCVSSFIPHRPTINISPNTPRRTARHTVGAPPIDSTPALTHTQSPLTRHLTRHAVHTPTLHHRTGRHKVTPHSLVTAAIVSTQPQQTHRPTSTTQH